MILSPALLDLYLSSDASICSTAAVWEIVMLSQFLFTFHQTLIGMLFYIAQHLILFVLIGTTFKVIKEKFRGTIFLKTVCFYCCFQL